MANGDILALDYLHIRILLLDGQTTTASSPWVEVPARYNIRSFWSDDLEEGATDATVDIEVSNENTQPSGAGDVSVQLTNTAKSATQDEAYRWVRATKTQGTTPGATTVILEAGRRA